MKVKPPPCWPIPAESSTNASMNDALTMMFLNRTPRPIIAFWYDTDGTVHSYGIIDVKKYAVLTSYLGHVWSFHDPYDGTILYPTQSGYFQNKTVPYLKISKTYHFFGPRNVTLVQITSNVQPLFHLAIRAVAKHTIDADKLQLPTSFKTEIKKACEIQKFLKEMLEPPSSSET